jgi:tRNA(Ile)-lysidine synthase
LLGHTADDLAEAAAMRAEGSSVSDPRYWSPSPVWPEGRGVMLLRPLLGERRAALRAWLSGRGETWLDDPANDDPRSARARARRAGASLVDASPAEPRSPPISRAIPMASSSCAATSPPPISPPPACARPEPSGRRAASDWRGWSPG